MAIVVNPDRVILSSVSYTEPYTSSISYTEAESLVSYLEASFSASWLDASVFAEVTFPDVLSVDIVTPVDLVTLSVTKVISDATDGFTDTLTSVFDKTVVDTPILNDLVVIGDIQPHRDGDDDAYPTDTITGFVFEKYLADTFEMLDVALAVRLYERYFSDDFTLPDVPYKSFIPKGKTDSAATSDTSYRGVDKALSDTFGMVDNMDGNIEYLLFKITSESILSSDAQTVDFKPNKADNVSTSSSGILAMQDYCDITYFLQDYVGTSRTLT